MQALEITGAVTPLGPAGYGEDGDLWTLGVSLRPWRNAEGVLVPVEIFLTRGGLSRAGLDRLQASLQPWEVVRVHLTQAPERRQYDSGVVRWEGKLLEVLDGAVPDAQLKAWVDQQRQPVVVHDAFFGNLQLDRRLNAYDGRRELASCSYELSIERPDEDDDGARDWDIIERARSVVARLESELPRYFGLAADDLIAIYNDNWREEEQPVLNREDFIGSLKLASVRLGSSGAQYIYLHPGDLFAGHWIELRAEASGEITSIGLAG